MTQHTQTTKELLEDLRTVAPKRRRREQPGLDKVVFGVAGVPAIGFVVWGLISPHRSRHGGGRRPLRSDG